MDICERSVCIIDMTRSSSLSVLSSSIELGRVMVVCKRSSIVLKSIVGVAPVSYSFNCVSISFLVGAVCVAFFCVCFSSVTVRSSSSIRVFIFWNMCITSVFVQNS